MSRNGWPRPRSTRAPGGRTGSIGSRRKTPPRFPRASRAAAVLRQSRTRPGVMLRSGTERLRPYNGLPGRNAGNALSHSGSQWRSAMRLKMLVSMIAVVAAGPALAQEGTLKKIKDTGAITLGHRESSVPFSYYDDRQQVVGYAMDLCYRIVDGVKAALNLPKLETKLNPVTSATRIPLIANGTVDLECGSTTNNLERQKQVSFTITHFVTANRFVSKKSANLKTVDDLKGKTVVSTS